MPDFYFSTNMSIFRLKLKTFAKLLCVVVILIFLYREQWDYNRQTGKKTINKPVNISSTIYESFSIYIRKLYLPIENGYLHFGYNSTASDQLPIARQTPYLDRWESKFCKDQEYSKNNITVSIIICFYNEHWITLWRTIFSIIRTSDDTITEIILVDDGSSMINLHAALDSAVGWHKT